MVRTVEHRHAEIHHGEAGEIAAHACFLDALFDGRNELSRNRAAEDVVDELEVRSARQRLHLDLAVAELPVAAGLLLVPAVRLRCSLDRLAVRNARRLQVDVDAEPALELRDRDFDVQLSLTREQQLFGLRIAAVADGRVLFLEPVHRRADLVFVAAASSARSRTTAPAPDTSRPGRPPGRTCRRACRWSACPSTSARRRGRRPCSSGTFVCVFPCSSTTWPRRSGVSRVLLCTVESVLSTPDMTRNIVMRPANGSAMVFQTNAEAAPLSENGRSISSSVFGLIIFSGRSAGDGT